jgi:hypothetical protein
MNQVREWDKSGQKTIAIPAGHETGRPGASEVSYRIELPVLAESFLRGLVVWLADLINDIAKVIRHSADPDSIGELEGIGARNNSGFLRILSVSRVKENVNSAVAPRSGEALDQFAEDILASEIQWHSPSFVSRFRTSPYSDQTAVPLSFRDGDPYAFFSAPNRVRWAPFENCRMWGEASSSFR